MSASSKKKLRKEQAAAVMTERQQQAQKESKQTKILTISFVTIVAIVLAVFLGSQIVNIFKLGGLIEKATIAATVNGHKLNSVTMNYFYLDAIESDYNSASETVEYYNSMGATAEISQILGYDPHVSLMTQPKNDSGKSWAAYYWDVALNNAKTIYGMYDLAQKAGFQLPANYASSIEETMMNMQLTAAFSGTDVDSLLRNIYGNGASEKNYREYMEIKAIASAYYEEYKANKTFTNDERAAYLAEHANDFTAYSFNYYTVSYSDFLPAKEGDSPTYTEEENNAAREEAKQAAEALATLTNLDDLDDAIGALAYNEDKSVTSYAATDIMHSSSSFTEEQLTWISAADRKAGDAKAFANTSSTENEDGTTTEVTNSYVVMMYVAKNEFSTPMGNVRHVLVSFEGGTYNNETGKTEYTAEEKAAAKTKAETMLAEWEKGDKSEASFIELTKQSADTASIENGGLYENVGKDSGYEANFEAWAIDPARKAGDHGIVESSYGYHIMYYSSSDELTLRDGMINAQLLTAHMSTWEESIVNKTTAVSGKTGKIKFDLIVSTLFGA